MADDASLNLNIGYQDAVKAASALGDFERAGKTAGSTTRELYGHMDALTAAMQKMMAVQAQTNELVKSGVAAQQQAARSTEDNIASMTRLQVGISAASFAWSAFRDNQSRATTEAAAGTQQMQAGFQRIGETIDGLSAKLTELRKQQDSFTLGNAVGRALDTAAPFLGAVGIDPFGIKALEAQIDAMGERLSRTINQAVLRTNVAGGSLLQGIAAGGRLGLDEQQSVSALAAMQRSLTGVGLEAERARATMRGLGVDTADAAKALTTTLDKLSQLPPSSARNSLLQQLVPGADPSILLRSNVLGSQPQGGQGRYEADQAQRVRELTAEIAKFDEALAIMNRDPNARSLFGLVEKNGRIPLPSFGQYFDENSQYSATERALQAREQTQLTAFWRGKAGLGETISNEGQNLFDATRNLLNPALGGLLGAPTVQGPAGQQGETAADRSRRIAAGLLSPEERSSVETFEANTGRQGPGTALIRLQRGQVEGADLLDKGLIDQEAYNQSIRLLTARYKRAVAPLDEMITGLAEQNRILALPPEARTREQILHLQRARGLTGQEPSSLVESDAAALAETVRQDTERRQLVLRLTNTSISGAAIAGAPLDDQGRLRAELQYRNQLYPTYGGAPPQLSPSEQQAFDANRTRNLTGSGNTLMAESDRAAANQKALTEAIAAGSGAVDRLKAAHQAEAEATKGLIDKSQEGARSIQLLSTSIAGMIAEGEKLLAAGRQSNYASGLRAGAAAGGPVAVAGANIEATVSGEFDAKIKAAQDQLNQALGAGDEGAASRAEADENKLWAQRAERAQQLQTDLQNRANEENRGRSYRLNRDLGYLSGGAGGASGNTASYRAMATAASGKYGIPPGLLEDQLQGESSFNPGASNNVGLGHKGIGQFDPPTAAAYGVDVNDPASSIDGAARYMADLHTKSGSWTGAMRGYLGASSDASLNNAIAGNAPYTRAYAAAQQADRSSVGSAPSAASSGANVRDISGSDGMSGWGSMDQVQGMIVHHTAGGKTVDDVLNVFKQRGVGSNFIIDPEGNTYQVLPEGAAGRHIMPGWGPAGAGKTNRNMEGVEVIAADDAHVNAAEKAAALALIQSRATQFGYDPLTSVYGHGEVNPGHRQESEGMTIVNAVRGGALRSVTAGGDYGGGGDVVSAKDIAAAAAGGVGEYGVGQAVDTGAGLAARASAGKYSNPILQRQAQREEEARREQQGIQPTPAEITSGASDVLAGQAQRSIETFSLRNKDTEATIQAERDRAVAIASGTRAQQSAEDAIKVETELRKAGQQAYESGNKEVIAAFEALKASTLGLTKGMRDAENQVKQAQIVKQFNDQQGVTSREITALQTGGVGAYEIQQRAEPIRKQFIDAGVDPAQAQVQAEAMAKAAQSADEYKKAILDTSNEIKSGLTQGVNSIVDGLTNSIGKAHGFRDAIAGIGQSLSKIGLDMFVKKPLDKLISNIVDGKGANFDSGGHSSSDVLGSALGGITKSLGGGGGSSSSSSGGGSMISKAFGGSGTMLGRLFGGSKDTGKSGGSAVDYGLDRSFGGYDESGNAIDASIGGGDYGGGGDFGSNPYSGSPGLDDLGGGGDYGGGGDVAGGLFGGFGDFFGGLFHEGGRIGDAGPGRLVPAALFRNAPRLHSGGLMPNEVPVIGLKGERVLSPAQTKQFDSGGMGNQTIVHAPIHVHANDADSFRRSDTQIVGAQQRSLDRALRRF